MTRSRPPARAELISLEEGEIQAVEHDLDKKDTLPVDKAVSSASADDYDGLILPGGTINPDNLRQDEDAVAFVQDFFKADKPVGAICHGLWTLVEADVVRGRTLTSYPSIRTDIRNAGGEVVDEEVVVDQGLVTAATRATSMPSARRSSRSSPRAGTPCIPRAPPRASGSSRVGCSRADR